MHTLVCHKRWKRRRKSVYSLYIEIQIFDSICDCVIVIVLATCENKSKLFKNIYTNHSRYLNPYSIFVCVVKIINNRYIFFIYLQKTIEY